MLRKILSVILIAIMVFTVCCGCTGNSKKGTVKNLGDVEVYSFYEPHFYNKDGSYNDKNATGIAAKKYEEMYGGKVKVTVVPYADYASTLQNLIAAGTQPDMVTAYWGDMPNWGISILQPVDDYIDVKSLNNPKIAEAYAVNGKHYALSIQQIQAQFLWYNRDVFERYGIEKTPYDLWKEGNWNWETFAALAKELTQDLDGDGVTDMYGFISNDPQIYHNSNSAPFVKMDGENVTLDWDSENSIAAFKMYKRMLTDEKIQNPDGEKIHEGAFENEQAAMAFGTFEFPYFRAGGMDIETIGCAPFPTGPNFDGNYQVISNLFGLVQGAKNTEGAIALSKLIEEASDEFEMGADLGNSDATDLLDEQAKEVITYVFDHSILSMDRGWGNFIVTFGEVFDEIRNGKNITTVLDSKKQIALAEINDTLERLKKGAGK